MNRLLKSITLAIILLFAMDLAAANNCITLTLEQSVISSDPEKYNPDHKGRRSMPIICIIDLISGTVQTTLTSEIISYEIWNSDGTALVAQYIDEPDFVGSLCDVSGFYQLRFITESYQYIGYIELPGK